MKTNHLAKASAAIAAASVMILMASCNKDNSVSTPSAVNQSGAAISQAVAVASTASGDSIYVINACGKGFHKDTVAASALPALVTGYLTGNYSGYTFQKAFTTKDTAGNLSSFVVIIQYNGKPVGLLFDASGNFVKVLEQREKADIGNDHGWHTGGFFDNRGGAKKDTIALGALPSTIKAYFTANYPQDTLVRAFRDRDSSIVVLSTDGAPFATVFSKTNSFVTRIQLPARSGKATAIDQNALPAAALQYLSATYPNYVFEHAFKIVLNGTTQGYTVFIDANGTKYGVGFDAAGTFVKAITVR